eukprot:7957128-Pyramimonas_sp.AAC.1
MLDAHGLCLASTFWNAGPTYYGAEGQATRPDYLVVPQGLLQNLQTCCSWWKAAKAVQQIKDNVPRDHVPLIASAEIGMPNNFTDMHRTLWDFDNA